MNLNYPLGALALLLLPLLFPVQAIAQGLQIDIGACYTGQPLLTSLVTHYKTPTTMGYGPARDTLYANIDATDTHMLSGVYSGFTITLDPLLDPSQDAFAKGINAEHIFPQSKGASSEPARSDMHHLAPSRVQVNAARASCPFGEIPDVNTDKWFQDTEELTTTPPSNIDAYSELDEQASNGYACTFEPRESVKGDIARSVFYFYTMYKPQADAADPNFFNTQKAHLLDWHYADPVDDAESERSFEIAARQNGRVNPFVIDSTLARRAYFEADDTRCPVLDVTAFLQGNYENDTLGTALQTLGLLPDMQPYAAAPWNYSGTEAITDALTARDFALSDWVLIGLREAGSQTLAGQAAAFLDEHGAAWGTDALSEVHFPGLAPASYYATITHRNHLAAMSALPLDFSSGAVAFDFKTEGTFGTNGQTEVSPGIFALWGGDGNADGEVTAFDFLNVWLPENGGPAAYTGGDFNLSGDVTAFDFLNVWLAGNGQATQVPD